MKLSKHKHLNLGFCEAFIAAAKYKSVTEAADQLGLTQAAVSRRISELEEALALVLVDREQRVFQPTDIGERFIKHAERLLDMERELKRRFSAQGVLTLRIGGIETVLHTWLIPLVDWLRREGRGRVEFELSVEMSHVLDQRLRQGSLDLVFSAAPVKGNEFSHEALPALEMVFVGPASLARKAPLGVDGLAAFELLSFQKGSKPYEDLLQLLRAHQLGDKRIHAVTSIWAMVKLVEAGFGLATLPRPVAEDLARQHEIALLACEAKLESLPLYASYRSQAAAPALERAIADALTFTRSLGAGEAC